MIKQLRNSFFQVFTGTTIWVSFLLTIFSRRLGLESISIGYVWNIIGVSLISASLFGVMYNALWNYLTLKPIFNILIASVLNILGGFSSIWLISNGMFNFISKWFLGVFILTLIIHTIAFYFYAKQLSKREEKELNSLLVENKKKMHSHLFLSLFSV